MRLTILLTMAFLIVGVTGGITILKVSVDRYTADYRSELANIASLAAMAVDPVEPSKLIKPEQVDSPLYQKQAVKLAEIKRRIAGARYIYTIRREASGYVFVLDPTPPGDHDGDGQDDKSYLGDPYPEISLAARTAYERGVVTVADEPTVDRWGAFISGFAPIKDEQGKVIAVIGIDRLAHDVLAHQRDLFNALIAGLIVVVFLGAFFSWSFTRKMASSAENRGWLRYLTGSRKIFRASILEIFLGGLTLVVFMVALRGISNQTRALESLRQSQNASSSSLRIASEIEAVLHHPSPTLSSIAGLVKTAQERDQAWIYQKLLKIQGIPVAGERDDALKEVSHELALQNEMDLQAQSRSQRAIAEHTSSLTLLFFMSAFLAVGTLTMIRLASIQQQDLVAAQTDSEWHQVAYRQVVENLPVGLYMFADGHVTFSNKEWDRQFQRTDNTDRLAAIEAVMSEPAFGEFTSILQEALASEKPFEHHLDLQVGDGQSLVMETRGVPLGNGDGEAHSLLGFTFDVTQRERTQELLRDKNREVQSKNRMLSRAITDLEENFEAMVQTLVKAVEAKDIYTAGHSDRVMQYSLRLGNSLQLSETEMRTLQMGTLVHDIGKIGVPDEVLNKPEGLTAEEFTAIQAHAENGARMVEGIPFFQDCIPIIRWHHERLDGSGYPDGLRGDQIPLLVRITSVADVFDAMTSSRAYRAAMAIDDACDVMRKMAKAGELDPEIVDILAEIVMKDGLLFSQEYDRVA
ncbi:MAG: HD domain-containing protein [Fimbriimonadaceae bacterium]|nr:HD domain-containing protein [Fimbriimonadaceae bacterium]